MTSFKEFMLVELEKLKHAINVQAKKKYNATINHDKSSHFATTIYILVKSDMHHSTTWCE